MSDETSKASQADTLPKAANASGPQDFGHTVSDGGVAASHTSGKDYDALVGTTTGGEFNTLVRPLRPCACWRINDMRFEFDSSFVLPEVREELRLLASLREAYPDSPLSVFAHADPVGNDDYNKALSGRRAIAIYALLTRKPALWEQLYHQPLGNDRWGRHALQTMLEELASPSEEDDPDNKDDDDEDADDSDNVAPVRHFWTRDIDEEANEETNKETKREAASPTAPSTPADTAPTDDAGPDASRSAGDPAAPYESDAGLRETLYLRYMNRLAGPALKLEPQEFLGRGADPKGKGDYQGCGEFNPTRLFSQPEAQAFNTARDKTERNLDNAPNRRVVIYLFEPGSQVLAARWPCPRAEEGAAGCRARFWSDAARRRANAEERREYADTADTFACRFYDRLAQQSPCEAAPEPLHIRLYDLDDNYIPHAPYRLNPEGGDARQGRANAGGFISTRATAGLGQARIEWGFPPSPGEKTAFVFADDIFLDVDTDDPDACDDRKLTNLGYTEAALLADKVSSFQEDYQERFQLQVTGQLDPTTRDAIASVHDGVADNLRTGQGGSADV